MNLRNTFLGAILCTSIISCEKGNDETSNNLKGDDYYNVIWCASDEGSTPSYTQAIKDISSGVIDGRSGFETPSVRSAYTFTSSDGAYLFNYSYGGGTFDKFAVGGGISYTSEGAQLNLTDAIGSAYGRCSKLNDKLASAHNIVTEPIFEDGGATYSYTKAVLKVAIIDLEEMVISTHKSIELPRNAYDKAENTYIWRVHMPYIKGDKIYYGIARSRANASNPSKTDKSKGRAGLLVMDYPSFDNPQILESGIEGVDGDTYGFRSRPMHEFDGAFYQLSMSNSHILKITGNAYDNSYVFSLQKALGLNDKVKAAGWHYVGNGIGYVPYGLDNGGENNWGLARVDLKTRTAVKLNIPYNMDFWEYQSSRLVGSKLYMAICPVDGDGHIYIFDTKSSSPDGFTKGAELKGAADAYYAGVF